MQVSYINIPEHELPRKIDRLFKNFRDNHKKYGLSNSDVLHPSLVYHRPFRVYLS